MSLYTPIVTSANNPSSSEYCYVTPSSLQHQAPQPPGDVAEEGYERPQPSIEYIASHQGTPMSSITPATTTVTNPSSSEYHYVMPASSQQQGSQPLVVSGDAQTVDSDGYLVLRS